MLTHSHDLSKTGYCLLLPLELYVLLLRHLFSFAMLIGGIQQVTMWRFCLVVMIMHLVFCEFRDMWFGSVHSTRHVLVRSVRSEWQEWMELSSANSSHRARMNKGTSCMYRENKSEPNTGPCGTPYFKGSKSDLELFTQTSCCRFDRNKEINLRVPFDSPL